MSFLCSSAGSPLSRRWTVPMPYADESYSDAENDIPIVLVTCPPADCPWSFINILPRLNPVSARERSCRTCTCSCSLANVITRTQVGRRGRNGLRILLRDDVRNVFGIVNRRMDNAMTVQGHFHAATCPWPNTLRSWSLARTCSVVPTAAERTDREKKASRQQGMGSSVAHAVVQSERPQQQSISPSSVGARAGLGAVQLSAGCGSVSLLHIVWHVLRKAKMITLLISASFACTNREKLVASNIFRDTVLKTDRFRQAQQVPDSARAMSTCSKNTSGRVLPGNPTMRCP